MFDTCAYLFNIVLYDESDQFVKVFVSVTKRIRNIAISLGDVCKNYVFIANEIIS